MISYLLAQYLLVNLIEFPIFRYLTVQIAAVYHSAVARRSST